MSGYGESFWGRTKKRDTVSIQDGGGASGRSAMQRCLSCLEQIFATETNVNGFVSVESRNREGLNLFLVFAGVAAMPVWPDKIYGGTL